MGKPERSVSPISLQAHLFMDLVFHKMSIHLCAGLRAHFRERGHAKMVYKSLPQGRARPRMGQLILFGLNLIFGRTLLVFISIDRSHGLATVVSLEAPAVLRIVYAGCGRDG